MYLNYLRTALSVLMRRKAFTALSLLGTVITLSILIVVVAIADNTLHPNGAESNNHNHLMITRLQVSNEKRTSTWRSSPGYKFLIDYVTQLKTPAMVSIFSQQYNNTIYQNQQKVSINSRYTDSNYWKAYNFTVLQGRLYTEEEVEQGAQVAVISQSLAQRLFGDQPALGNSLTLAEVNYQIIGIVADESHIQDYVSGDAWMPNSTNMIAGEKERLIGSYNALLVAHSPNDFDKIQAEYQHILRTIDIDPVKYAHWVSFVQSPLDVLAGEFIPVTDDQPQVDTQAFVAGAIAATIMFMLLPTLNLVNLNISRIMERSSEIGVKKSFGATTSTLVKQFIFENIVLTIIGGMVSFLVAYACLKAIEFSGVIAYAELTINLFTFSIGIAIMLFFGVLSGVIPAWKMARLHPVHALKGVTA